MLGLVGIADPPRGEAIAAIAAAKRAGIDTIMITGDHPITACAIGRELGLIGEGQSSHGIIHARATPADKLRVVRELKARGEIVAMTGDGVNDAPALREAHIGIAMGRSGSEVTREASDLVLADDNVASLVAAVREGRGIFDNIRKTLVYLLTGNFAELLVMLAAAVAGLPLPLLPLQLLWVNLVTDGMPALALVMDRPDPDVLARPPRRTDEPMLGRAQWRSVLAVGALQATVVLCVYAWALDVRGTDAARALTFSTLVFSELFRAFGAHPTRTTWQVGIFSNVRLLAVVVMSVALQVAIDEIPAAQAIFQIGPLAPGDLVLSLALGLVTLLVVDATKLFRRARGQSVALR
jgi:Ca2+-transporting ATPase